MSKKLTTEQFIEKAKSVHGDKYDYSKVKYIISNSMKTICQNASPYDKKTITELLY